MTESKYGKYICTELKKNIKLPGFKGDQVIRQGAVNGVRPPLEHIIWMDSEVIPGAFYSEIMWCWPTRRILTPAETKKMPGVPPHTHPFTEIMGYFGTNLEDPGDLCGEIELWLEDEQFILTRSFIAYFPAGMVHCPLKHLKQDKPMFHFTMGPGQVYT
jgi:hypothetical protein